jgi:hypothetical protein
LAGEKAGGKKGFVEILQAGALGYLFSEVGFAERLGEESWMGWIGIRRHWTVL